MNGTQDRDWDPPRALPPPADPGTPGGSAWGSAPPSNGAARLDGDPSAPPSQPLPPAADANQQRLDLRLPARLHIAARALVGIFLVSVTAGLFPLQLSSAAWYLKATSAMVNNSPVLIVGLCLAWAALYLDRERAPGETPLRPYRALGHVFNVLFVLLIPIHLVAAVSMQGELAVKDREDLNVLHRNLDSAILQIRAVTTPEALAEVYARLANRPLEGDAGLALTLEQRKEWVVRALTIATQGLEVKQAGTRMQHTVGLATEALRVVIASLLIALALHALARWHRGRSEEDAEDLEEAEDFEDIEDLEEADDAVKAGPSAPPERSARPEGPCEPARTPRP